MTGVPGPGPRLAGVPDLAGEDLPPPPTTAEGIVELLATVDPALIVQDWHVDCRFCDNTFGNRQTVDRGAVRTLLEGHKPACPYRLAVEWAARP